MCTSVMQWKETIEFFLKLQLGRPPNWQGTCYVGTFMWFSKNPSIGIISFIIKYY